MNRYQLLSPISAAVFAVAALISAFPSDHVAAQSNGVVGTHLMGMAANDSMEVPTGYAGGLMYPFNVPAGETWTLHFMSDQFYTAYQGMDPQAAMFHIVVTVNNQDMNVYTQTLRTQEMTSPDGQQYWDYRNKRVKIAVTGPAAVRVIGYNNTPASITFGLGGLWEKRQS